MLLIPWSVAADRKLLHFTYSGGFLHGSVAVSEQVLAEVGRRSGAFEVTVTGDPAQINAANLANFDGVFFYTTGEPPFSAAQKQALLDFVRNGKGFGAVHSATDTFYTWPEYGELIGGYFDEHPWTQTVRIEVEDPEHPAVRHLAPTFTILEEIYQFRSFSRERVRVLMTLDTRSVDMTLPNIHRTDGDFALAWVRRFGAGRVFYSALGHFNETWADMRFQQHLMEGIRWMMGDVEGSAEPRPRVSSTPPRVNSGGMVNAASFAAAPNAVAAGSIISIFGTDLTNRETRTASSMPLPTSMAGTTVTINGLAAPLFFVSPRQINCQAPVELATATTASVVVTTPAGVSAAEGVTLAAAAAGVFTLDSSGGGPAAAVHLDGRVVNAQNPARRGDTIQVVATGLGATTPVVASGQAASLTQLVRTVVVPAVTVGGVVAEVVFSGLAPGFVGLNQVNVVIPPAAPTGAAVELVVGTSNRATIAVAP